MQQTTKDIFKRSVIRALWIVAIVFVVYLLQGCGNPRLAPVEERDADRESLEMSSFGDVFDYNVKSDKCEKFFSIKVTYIKERIPLRWRFDADSMRSVRAVATDSESHRYIFAMNIFEKFNYTEGIEVIINIFQSSPDHFVRWEAAKTILKLDTSLGIDLLKTAASNDSHPHVRTAAKKTLKNLKKLEVV